MMNGFGNIYGFGWWGMGVGMILVLGVLALLAWAVFSMTARGARAAHETPLAILQRRLAADEISAAEFEQARKALG